ncbi:MAG: hypothetical protein MI751_01835 [Pseudomonadales bacterium]|uniref:hypothetical protein n=1 Tax=Alcanivorax sp. MD8A TaxID=1177157 RepID=UPI000C9A6BBD|nr:hypothetical protein [Alcanivorax sp. MD8A]MCG8436806.1 hypothetical protein [Pseudomonadales bacterium]MEE2871106.1 hypothetical protein [Pseudomonadota bacterium]PNE02881.1 hypothetical protein A15D_01490 [Alcanivorax sp. MD8A]|tara:strand:+ start:3086 stop:3838 length:753 start_codon:yes stop_codon:yes gene_type:complete
MAVVWSADRDGVHYEVRQAGKTLRLYANGIQHSEFHPGRLLTGSVWDLLWLPALLHEPSQCRRVLVLGLGGGSLIPPLRRLIDPEILMAVELDAPHLEVAREVFAIESFGVDTWLADARLWLQAYDGPPFDLIIEDLFAPSNDQVTRAVAADPEWFACLADNLTPTGTLVMNFGDWQEYRDSPVAADWPLAEHGFASRFRLSCSDCHNAVMAFTREPARSIHLRRRIASTPELNGFLAKRRLDYHIRQLD